MPRFVQFPHDYDVPIAPEQEDDLDLARGILFAMALEGLAVLVGIAVWYLWWVGLP